MNIENYNQKVNAAAEELIAASPLLHWRYDVARSWGIFLCGDHVMIFELGERNRCHVFERKTYEGGVYLRGGDHEYNSLDDRHVNFYIEGLHRSKHANIDDMARELAKQRKVANETLMAEGEDEDDCKELLLSILQKRALSFAVVSGKTLGGRSPSL